MSCCINLLPNRELKYRSRHFKSASGNVWFFSGRNRRNCPLAYAKLSHINIDNPTHILAYARPLIGQYIHITNTLNQNQKGQKGRFMENQIFAAI